MAAQRTSFEKLQRDRAKKAKQAAKREKRFDKSTDEEDVLEPLAPAEPGDRALRRRAAEAGGGPPPALRGQEDQLRGLRGAEGGPHGPHLRRVSGAALRPLHRRCRAPAARRGSTTWRAGEIRGAPVAEELGRLPADLVGGLGHHGERRVTRAWSTVRRRSRRASTSSGTRSPASVMARSGAEGHQVVGHEERVGTRAIGRAAPGSAA